MHGSSRCPADFICGRDCVRLYVFKCGCYLIHRVVDCSVKFICLVHRCVSEMFLQVSRRSNHQPSPSDSTELAEVLPREQVFGGTFLSRNCGVNDQDLRIEPSVVPTTVNLVDVGVSPVSAERSLLPECCYEGWRAFRESLRAALLCVGSTNERFLAGSDKRWQF